MTKNNRIGQAEQPTPAKQTALPGVQTHSLAESFLGHIDKIIFHNPENAYTVASFKVSSQQEFVIIGCIHSPNSDAPLSITGEWVRNPRYGLQFKVHHYEEKRPTTTEGMVQYLSSGLIKGVGAARAKMIVDYFGPETFNILDNEINRLREIKKISKALFESIAESWQKQQGIKELILFLQPHNISTAYATRIHKYYGDHSLAVVKENPYRLSMDIHGVGFATADMIAQKLGFAEDSKLRAEAAALYELTNLTKDGHVCYPRSELMGIIASELGVPEDVTDLAIKRLLEDERLAEENVEGTAYVYLRQQYYYESSIAHYLGRLLLSPKSTEFTSNVDYVEAIKKELPIALAAEQELAVRTAVKEKVLVITGGPGTGKTTIINAIIKVFIQAGAKVLAAAPTGRAAKRLSETSGLGAKTIHRLLEYNPHINGFAKNEDSPLACGLLVIDEASMLDIQLTHQLLKAVPLGATVILVGDAHQLPSVGPGNVLKDIITSKVVPVAELNQIFRQSEKSDIVLNAHLINNGNMPLLDAPSTDELSDFYFIQQETAEGAAKMVVDLVCEHIPRRFGFDSVNDIQVLAPMNRGIAGVINLNTVLQEALNKNETGVTFGDRKIKLGDKVMQIRNNYDKETFNGDIGCVVGIDQENREIHGSFDDRLVPYSFEELDELVPAYAISVHKSQGSEYPAVVIPLLKEHYMMLQRNLVYTGITRGKRLVILVGSKQALGMAVKNNKTQKRYSWLQKRLFDLLGSGGE